MEIKSYLRLIPAPFQKKMFAMGLLGILRRVLDLVGLAPLLSVVIIVLNPSAVKESSWMAGISSWIGSETIVQFGLVLSVVALMILPLKSVITIWLSKIQNEFLLGIYKYYSHRLFFATHERGLLYIRTKHSSQFAIHINNACYGYAHSVVATLLNAGAEMVVTLLLVGFACWMAPLASILLFLSIVPVLAIYFFGVKKQIKELGKRSYEVRLKQSQIVHESLRGHVSLKINDSFDSVSKEFNQGLDDISHIDIKNAIYNAIPSALLQLCVAIALIILLWSNGIHHGSSTLFILFGFAAVRIMPSVLELANSWNVLQNSHHIVEMIHELRGDEPKEHQPDENEKPLAFNHEIKLDRITFAYDNELPIFSSFSLTVHKGECLGVRGASGAGKSTLFHIMMGFCPCRSGSVSIDGVELTSETVRSWHKIVGYCEQDVFIANDTLLKNITLSSKSPDKGRALDVLHKVGLKNWVDEQKEGIDTVIGENGATVSGGERQRIGIARVLYKRPQVLFFDESTSSLDAKNEDDIISLLQSLMKENLTLIIISHRESSLRHCTRIIDI